MLLLNPQRQLGTEVDRAEDVFSLFKPKPFGQTHPLLLGLFDLRALTPGTDRQSFITLKASGRPSPEG